MTQLFTRQQVAMIRAYAHYVRRNWGPGPAEAHEYARVQILSLSDLSTKQMADRQLPEVRRLYLYYLAR